ncbi:MAG: Sec-independent protein translocase protein TatB [Desulfovibrionaceae bacterium]|nr:Sec-independent protein translocase protein TatB [Desulfovibrionaceae bacterium]
MFGIGSTEFIVILLVALLVLGPKSLAKVTRTVGKYVGEFRRVSTEFQRTLNAEVAEEERQEKKEAIRQKAAKAKEKRAREQASAEKAAAEGSTASQTEGEKA